MPEPYNGISATELGELQWRKSGRSSAQGNCVETAQLAGGAAAIRNSRHPEGPALVFHTDEIRAFIEGAKDGDFDYLLV
jgi:hypothetical protein